MISVVNKLNLSLFILSWLASGCIKSSDKELFSIQGQTMGTTYSVKFFSSDKSIVSKVKKRVEADLKEVNRQMSTYIHDSEISKINKAAKNTEVKISPWFAKTLQLSLKIAKDSNGKFDPTIGPLVNLWGFGPKKSNTPPSEKEIQRVKSFVGFEKVKLMNNTVSKSHDQVYIDLSASAKGLGVDVISEALTSMGLNDHLVEIGGEMRAKGRKPSEPWRIAIEKPDTERRAVHRVLALNDLALATSGSYRNFFVSGEKSYSHTIDQQTGKPVQHHLVSVSILAEDCLRADAYATALMAMGKEQAVKFAKENQIAAYLISSKEVDGKKQTDVFMTETVQTTWECEVIFVYTFIAIALFIILMALGVIFSNREIKGSCGGLGKIMGEKCAFCERKDDCKKRRQQEAEAAV